MKYAITLVSVATALPVEPTPMAFVTFGTEAEAMAKATAMNTKTAPLGLSATPLETGVAEFVHFGVVETEDAAGLGTSLNPIVGRYEVE